MEVKMVQNTFLMGKLYKMGYTYDIPEEYHQYLDGKIELIEIDYTKYTNKKLRLILDEQGIEYNSKGKKDELLALLGGE